MFNPYKFPIDNIIGLSTALAGKVNTNEVGTAAAKNYTTEVTSSSSDLVTSGGVYTAISTAITQVLDTPF